MKRLLIHGQFGYPSRSLVGRSSTQPSLCNNVLPRYHSTEKDDDTLSETGEKARSTAEFLRVAKEKSDEISEGAKETLHETKEAVLGESDEEEFKQRVEEGTYQCFGFRFRIKYRSCPENEISAKFGNFGQISSGNSNPNFESGFFSTGKCPISARIGEISPRNGEISARLTSPKIGPKDGEKFRFFLESSDVLLMLS